jgi:hypothetical protein
MGVIGIPGLGIQVDIIKDMNSPDDLSPVMWLDAAESEVTEEGSPS